ncbi:hypothetical protein BJX61DRAFT_545716 [Aspergillus egyptiacus]|nr:hypothetical protein BJX61DRAFT_545716 [Aspergillus egyptiacus]
MGSLGEFEYGLSSNDSVENQWIWNTKVPADADSIVHDLIAARVRDQPHAEAVCAWDGSLTYQQLDDLSQRLACYLIDRMNIGEGCIIPLCFEKGMWTPVAMLAVMKTGAASVALDVTLPQHRLQSIVKQIQAPFILSSAAQYGLAGDLDAGQVVTVDHDSLCSMNTTGIRLPRVQPSSTLYVVFTSGSTGTPKGVMISHSNITSGLRHQKSLGYATATRVFDFASYAFDAAWLNFLHSTVWGACLCIPSETGRRENITKCLQDMSVDFALLTPSIARVIDPAAVPTLRTLALGGEALTEVDIATWASHLDLRNAYGPAECSIVATTAKIRDGTTQTGNIGYGVGLNPWVVEVDGDRLAPIGSVGELWLEGPLVAKGYLNDPVKTAASFVENPPWLMEGYGCMSGRPGRLYRTGDLVRYNGDGSLVFVGRKDSQIKIRGQRVELGDIEHHVQSCLSFEGHGPVVAVVARPSGSDKMFLVVFLSVSRALMDSYRGKKRMVQDLTGELHDKLMEELPMYMVPSAYIPLAEMPMTATGKTDRRQLQEIANTLTAEQLIELHPKWTGKREPETEMEKLLQGLWAQVLNIKPSSIGLDDTFFSHGGDSITAIQLTAKCRAAGFIITIPQIFRHKSLQDLAAGISPLPSMTVRKPQADPKNTRFALSPIQQYFFEHYPDGNNHFNQSFFLRLTRRIDPTQLAQSLRQLVSWHPILRAKFHRSMGGSWTQSIRAETDQCHHYHVTRIEEPDQVREVLSATQERLHIEKGPLFAVELIETSDSQCLFLVAHHLVVDLVSWRILLEELEGLLTRGRTTREHSSLTFQTWCKLQETYSMRHLPPEKCLPFSVPPPSYKWWGLNAQDNTHAQSVESSFVTGKKLTDILLGDANRAFDTRPVEILHAVLLHAFVTTFRDRPAPTVFSEGHGREAFDATVDLSKTVGWFTTIWPAFIDCNSQHSIAEVVRRTKDVRRQVPMNGWAYFASRYLNASGKAKFRGHGLPEVLFNFEGQYQQLERPDSLFRTEDKPAGSLSDFSGDTRLSAIVDVTALVVDGCLKFQFLYHGNMMRRNGVERWTEECKQSLELAGQELLRLKPSYTICDFPLLSLTDETLRLLNDEVLPAQGISYGEVEDIYPCSPMQQGILLSQAKNAGWYNTQVVWQLRSLSLAPVSVPRLQRAWKEVVQRHAILRTVFVDGVSGGSYRDQVVLKRLDPAISWNGEGDSAVEAPWRTAPTQLHSLSLGSNSSGEVTATLDINHALIDAASLEILRRDLCSAYSGSKFPTNDVSYRGYIEVIQGLQLEPARTFWTQYLEGVKASIFSCLHHNATCGSHVELPMTKVSTELQGRIHAFSETHGVTPSDIFQLAWALVLNDCLKQDEVCFGYIVSGRDAPVAHVEDIIGPFINMLVSRVSLSDSSTVLQTLQKIQDNYLESLSHQHYPLASVLNSLGMTGKQLFNTVLQVQRDIGYKNSGDSDIWLDIIDYKDPMEFDISVTVAENDGAMDISMQYGVSILTEMQATSLVDSFQRAIEEITRLPKSSVTTLSTIGPRDLERIFRWNSEVLQPNAVCVHNLFADRVRQQPDAPAVCAWDGDLTYSQLDDLSTALAYHLLGLGIGPGYVVPLCFEKSVWTPVAVMGVMKTGAASVILDVTLPKQRLLSIIDQVGPAIMLTSTVTFSMARDIFAGPTVCVDTLEETDQPPRTHLPTVDPSNTLYVVFTSGSTGKSKGAMISHTNFSSGIKYQIKRLGHCPSSRVFDFVSYSFDVCWSNILHTLIGGGCLCTPSTADLRNDINGALRMTRANWAILTPTVARLLDPSVVGDGFKLVLIGEKMTDQDVAKWLPHVELLNTYGPAECTVIDTVVRVSNLIQGSSIIGRGVGCHTWVVDPSNHQHLLPVGSIGELLLEGPLVGQGYLGDPAKTAMHFVEAPEWLKQGCNGVLGREGLLYKTGDLVQYEEDGSLRFVGRKDDQVKIHGQRVELGDIEHHARQVIQAELQEECEVVAETIHPDGSDDAVLVAFLTTGREQCTEARPALHHQTATLRERLSSQLPIHMVPFSFIVLDAIPTTATGKTDRRKLRELGSALTKEDLTLVDPSQMGPSDQNFDAVMTSTEAQLRHLWAEVLGRSATRINANDNFLQIGGDSIGAMRLVVAARNEGLSLTVEKIFQSPRLRDMVLVTGVSHATQHPIAAFSLLPRTIEVERLCEDVAQRCRVQVNRIQDVFPYYMNQVTLQVSPGTDVPKLMRAWEKVIYSTPILRTRIVDTLDYGLVQVVISEEVAWQTSEDLGIYLEQDTQKPIGLGTPLTHFGIVNDACSGGKFLVWTIHHALYDGWSIQLILDQVYKVYGDEDASPLVSFQRFLQHTLRTESPDEFWQQYLSTPDVASYPQLPNPSYRPQADAVVSRELNNITWPENRGITSATVFRAAWAILQSQYTNTPNVVFGAISSGRQAPVPGIEHIAGPTIATVPVHVKVDRTRNVRQLLLEIQNDTAAMIRYEQTGLQTIRQMNPAVAKASEFQTLLVINTVARDADDKMHSPWKIKTTTGKENGSFRLNNFNNYSILLDCQLKPTGADLSISFDTQVIEEWVVQRMTGQLEQVIKSLCDTELHSMLVKDISTISDNDLNDIYSWNANLPESRPACVHTLIAEQARKHPDKEAVCSWEGSLTYAELDALSTSLAQGIVSKVGPGCIVPLCFEKSMWTPIAMLAVMKTGAASVALDTTLPKQRIQSIIDQVKPPLILSSRANASLAAGLSNNLPGSQVIPVDYEYMKMLGVMGPKPELPLVDPSSTLYLVFTSGSTGTPKGAVVSHTNFSSSLHHQLRALQYNTETRAFDFASYAFDVSRTVCLRTLAAGGCLCVPHETDRRNNIAGAMRQLDVNYAHLTPTVTRLLLPSDVPGLRTLVTGGEPLGKADIERWRGHVVLINTYGPAETTSTNTIQGIKDTEAPSIGRGVGCITWVADPSNSNVLVPIGCAGELLIEGPLVGQGYLRDRDRTTASFIEHPPWLQGIGRRGTVYRTGDLVRYNSDGSLVFLGRKDDQVKIRGQRVELGDIEHHVRSILSASKFQGSLASAVASPHGKDAAFVVIFLAMDKPRHEVRTYIKSLEGQLQDGLADRLPPYMIPRAYIPLETMPLTATGKVDRRRIQEVSAELTLENILEFQPQGDDRHAPSTDMERRLAELWARILNIPINNIASGDSFFQVGGDSVGAMRLVGAAREQSLSLTVEQVFKSPRLCDMALIIKADDSSEKIIAPFSLLRPGVSDCDINVWLARVASLCNVEPCQIEDAFPCTQLQQGILALSEKAPGNYINQVTLKVDRSRVSLVRLKHAWEQTIRTTPILRTRIVDFEGHGILQVVISDGDVIQEVAGCPLAAHIESDRNNPMALGTPLARLAFIDEGDTTTPTVHLVWTLHHALYDGWMMELILNQVHSIYWGKAERPHSEPFQKFLHYSMQTNRGEESFWNEYLANPNISSFPTLPSTSYQAQADSMLRHEINDLTWRRHDDITASNTIRTAWGIVLSCYTETQDVLFGATVSGRQAAVPGVENIAGPTIATVPVRISVDQQVTVRDMLQQVQKEALDMVPFEQTGLQRIRRISPSTNRGCQFQTLVVVQPSQGKNTVDEETIWEVVQQNGKRMSSFNSYAILVECQIKPNGAQIDVSFDSTVIDQNTMKRLVQQLHHILRLLCTEESNDMRMDKIEMTGPGDLLNIWMWNASYLAAHESTIHHMIASQAAKTPEAPAICAWDGELTYRQLDNLSTCLARYLLTQYSCAGAIIPLCLEKSMWTPVAMLAVMKTGAAAVALDVELPQQRLESVVNQVEPVVILSSATWYELATSLSAAGVIRVDHQSLDSMKHSLEGLTGALTTVQLPLVDPSSILYIVFTSGSTGNPKGVMVSHTNFSTAFHYQRDALGYASSTRILDFASYAFDAAWLNFLHSAISGACLCIPSNEARKTDIAGCINHMRVDCALLTPSVARLIDPATVPTLRTLILGGESHTASDIARWKSHPVQLHNAYGPAECTIVATVTPLPKSGSKPGHIGRGIGLNTWIVDTSNSSRLAPVGAVGELWLEGPLVAQGYLGDSKKTSQSFIKDPSWLAKGVPDTIAGRQGHVYRTGDLVRYNHDGSLSFIGRKDSQVKINGQRVELDEVEHHVRQCMSIPFQGSVIAEVFAPAGSGHSVLAVFVAGCGDTTLSDLTEGLSDRLMDRLPEYMIPTAYIPVGEMPMTATGKTDRRRLREMGSSRTITELTSLHASRTPDPPASKMEWQLHAMWAELLNIDPSIIGRNDSFFHFGGDSITAMQLCAKCRVAGIGVTVPQVFRHRTISRLAEVVTVDSVSHEHDEMLDTSFALSPTQQMFFAHEPHGHDHFNQSMLLQLTRSVTSLDVTQALESLLMRHSMLRAQFSEGPEGAWTQRISTSILDTSYRYQSHDVISVKDSVRAINQSQTSLSIRQGPLVAADLINTKDGQYLFLVVHHLVIDLVSWRILLSDLEEHLQRKSISSLAPLSYQLWCEGQKSDILKKVSAKPLESSNVRAPAYDYWGMDLSKNKYGAIVQEGFSISEDSVQSLFGAANDAFQTQPVEIFHAALIYSFARVFQDRRVPPICIEEHGRESRNSELDPSGTIGWFTRLRPIFAAINREEGLEDAVCRVKDARRHPNSTAAHLRDTGRSDVPEIIFNYSGHYQQLERQDSLFRLAEEPAGMICDIADDVHRFAIFDVAAFVKDGSLQFKFTYNRLMKQQDSISEWIATCKSVLEEAALILPQTPQRYTLSDFKLLPVTCYDELDMLIHHTLPLNGILPDQVEDIYPCSPVQHGILLSQARNQNQYWTRKQWQICSSSPICLERFKEAWKNVVHRHTILRTVFIDSISPDAYQDQVVLKSVDPEVYIVAVPDVDIDSSLAPYQPSRTAEGKLPYSLFLYTTPSGRVMCELLISHALVDGLSMRLLQDDLQLAYDNALPTVPAPPYSDYITHIRSLDTDTPREYWQKYLAGARPCVVPSMTDSPPSKANVTRLPAVNLDDEVNSLLRDICKTSSLTPANIFQVAWALVLHRYTGSAAPCFGYLTSGRDAPIDEIQAIAGPFINILVSQIPLPGDKSVIDIMQQNQSEYLEKLEYQHFPLAEILHSLPAWSTPLFNTAISVQSGKSGPARGWKPSIRLEDTETEDPTEYDIAINMLVDDAGVQLHFGYCASVFSEEHVTAIRSMFLDAIKEILLSPSQRVGELNIMQQGSFAQ